MVLKGLCGLCGGNFKELSRRDVAGTTYVMLQCEKCGHIVARSE